MSTIDRVRAYLRQWDLDDKVLEFDVSSATVELAAQALGVEGALIAKSLTFLVDDRPVMIVAAGDAKIDNARFKAQFHTKAKMLSPEQCETLVGHAVGGVCPFALNEGVTVYLDGSLRRFETIYPACGSSNSAIPLSCEQLETISGGTWIDVCKGWREE
ncbi:MAG: YbaK/EbsC family protein [Clostridiales bacterium]|nr:YbaK/EbsC family protein [Clostridiales bacterium]